MRNRAIGNTLLQVQLVGQRTFRTVVLVDTADAILAACLAF
jgi:hypothetical protein